MHCVYYCTNVIVLNNFQQILQLIYFFFFVSSKLVKLGKKIAVRGKKLSVIPQKFFMDV